MYLVVRDENRNVDKVYGYVSTTDIVNYAKQNYPRDNFKWEKLVPKDYTGDIEYLPED